MVNSCNNIQNELMVRHFFWKKLELTVKKHVSQTYGHLRYLQAYIELAAYKRQQTNKFYTILVAQILTLYNFTLIY